MTKDAAAKDLAKDAVKKVAKKKPPVTSGAGSSTQQVPTRHKNRGVNTEFKRGLTSSGIRKVARRAAVGNIAADIYNEARDHLDAFLHNAVYGACRYVKARKAKQVTRADISHSLHHLGIEVV